MEKRGVSNSKFWNAFMFVMHGLGMVILYLFFCIPYLPLILISVILFIVAVLFWHALFLHMLGFWPAIIADILLAMVLFFITRKDNENNRYKAELRAKEIRGETLQPWENEAIHPAAGLSFTDTALGLIFWKLFFGNGSNKK